MTPSVVAICDGRKYLFLRHIIQNIGHVQKLTGIKEYINMCQWICGVNKFKNWFNFRRSIEFAPEGDRESGIFKCEIRNCQILIGSIETNRTYTCLEIH